jgi:L-cysteine/cystine lyase
VRVVPFEELPGEVGPDTRFVVCSHVSWATGRVMDTGPLKASEAIVVLDGAQGLGGVPTDARELGCDFYAASGQKWLCGPGGIGYLYANPELVPSLPAPWSGYHVLEDSERGLEPALWPDARRLGTAFPPPHHVEWTHAALDVLEAAGFDRIHELGVAQADRLADLLREHDVSVAPRGASTLVSFEVPDPPAFAEKAGAEGLVIRGIPGSELARASVGAWNSGDEIERLAALASRP